MIIIVTQFNDKLLWQLSVSIVTGIVMFVFLITENKYNDDNADDDDNDDDDDDDDDDDNGVSTTSNLHSKETKRFNVNFS